MSHTQTPLTYRPSKYDDWGVIRNADDMPIMSVRLYAFMGEADLAKHRSDGTDPCRDLGNHICRCVNAHDGLVEACKAAKLFVSSDYIQASDATSAMLNAMCFMLEAALAAAEGGKA